MKVASKKGRHVAKKDNYKTKVTNQGHSHVFIHIILCNIILVIFLIFYLKITSMMTNTVRNFSNSKVSNNCIIGRKYPPFPDLFLHVCSSCHHCPFQAAERSIFLHAQVTLRLTEEFMLSACGVL